MSDAKLHHYVPQFHLRRFSDAKGKIWAWDRERDRSFPTATSNVAAETQFYRLTEFERVGHDPLTMEKQLAGIEAEVSKITDQWLEWLPVTDPCGAIDIPAINREIVAQFVAIQYLRTADVRDILAALASGDDWSPDLSDEERRRLHVDLMWDMGVVSKITGWIAECSWVFCMNETETPYVTSDNPVAFRTFDNRRWVRLGATSPGVYAVYPLSPTVVMYAFPKEPPYDSVAKFDNCRSPALVTSGMVESENSGQVFMATRFVFSNQNDFEFVREFAPTIGTDVYANPAITED